MAKTYTKTFYPTSFEVLNASGGTVSVTNANNCIGTTNGDPTKSSYGQFYHVTGSYAETFGWWSFDLSEISNIARIDNISGQFKVYTGGNQNQTPTHNFEVWCNNRQTQKGSDEYTRSTTSIQNVTIDAANTWTGTLVRSLEYLIYIKRGNKQTTSNYYTRPYGASITITWTEPEFFIKENNNWVGIDTIWKKENGVWVAKDLDYLENNLNGNLHKVE